MPATSAPGPYVLGPTWLNMSELVVMPDISIGMSEFEHVGYVAERDAILAEPITVMGSESL